MHDQGDAETFTVIALSGLAGHSPDRQRGLGPFHSREQARGAIAALGNALHAEGFIAQEGGIAQWQLIAARAARSIREEREQNAVNTDFVPLGIVPDDNAF